MIRFKYEEMQTVNSPHILTTIPLRCHVSLFSRQISYKDVDDLTYHRQTAQI